MELSIKWLVIKQKSTFFLSPSLTLSSLSLPFSPINNKNGRKEEEIPMRAMNCVWVGVCCVWMKGYQFQCTAQQKCRDEQPNIWYLHDFKWLAAVVWKGQTLSLVIIIKKAPNGSAAIFLCADLTLIVDDIGDDATTTSQMTSTMSTNMAPAVSS